MTSILTGTFIYCLQCFDTVSWAAGRHPVCEKLSGGVLAWLSLWNKVHTYIWPSWCHCHSMSLASMKSRLVLPFWYRLTWVVSDKGPLNVCVCVYTVIIILSAIYQIIWPQFSAVCQFRHGQLFVTATSLCWTAANSGHTTTSSIVRHGGTSVRFHTLSSVRLDCRCMLLLR